MGHRHRPERRRLRRLLLPVEIVGITAVVLVGFTWQVLRDIAVYKGWYTPVRSEDE